MIIYMYAVKCTASYVHKNTNPWHSASDDSAV